MMVKLSQRLRAFPHRQDGATALEFALVGPVFFALIFSMIETGWIMTKGAMLDYAVGKSARMIYTGQAPDQGVLEAVICEEAQLFSNCAENLNVELIIVDDFTSLPDTDVECTDANAEAEIAPVVQYSSGSGGEIVLMRVCVTTDVLTPGLGLGMAMSKTGTGRFQMVSTMAFMNEPF